jgi:hypothetical protein
MKPDLFWNIICFSYTDAEIRALRLWAVEMDNALETARKNGWSRKV